MTELVNQLGIDGRLLLAQVVNFLILLYVLKRFAFGPLKSFLHKRQARIEKGLKDADYVAEQREKLKILRAQLRAKAQEEAELLLSEARTKAEGEYEVFIKRAQTRAEEIMESAKQEIINEKRKALIEAQRELGALVVMATERVLREKVDERKDAELVERALREIR